MTEQHSRTDGVQARLAIGGDADPDELDRLTSALQRELADVPAVERVARAEGGSAPPGTRAVDPVALGTLVLTLAKTAAGLGATVRAVQSWLSGQPKRCVTIRIDGDELVLRNATAAQQEEALRLFVARHTAP